MLFCMLSSINTCLVVVYVTCLNSTVVEHLLLVQEVPGSILGLCYIVALHKRLQSAPVYAGCLHDCQIVFKSVQN